VVMSARARDGAGRWSGAPHDTPLPAAARATRLWRSERLWAALALVVVLVLAFGLGVVATLQVSTLKLAVLVVGALLLPLVLFYLELGVLAFIGVLWARVSDIAIWIHGFPSITTPFSIFLIANSLVRKLLAGERIGLATFRDLAITLPYAAVVLLSAFWSAHPGRAVTVGGNLLKDLIIYWIIADTIRTARALKRAMQILVLTAACLSLLSLHQYFTGNFPNNYWGFAQSEVLHILGDYDSYRLGGPLNSSVYFAVILVVTIPMGLALLRISLDPFQRTVTALALVPIVLAALLTYSRGGALVLALVVGLSLLRHRLRLQHLLVGGLALAFIAVATPPVVWERIETLGKPFSGREVGGLVDASVEIRLGAQLTAVEMFLSNPLVGVGAGNYPPLYAEYSRYLGLRSVSSEFTPHNLYLEILAETGLLGLLAYAQAALVPLLALRRARRAPSDDPRAHDRRELQAGLEIAFVGYLAASFLLHGAYPRYFWILLALVVGASYARRP
jgi:putative inorganic carbon (hco3(-)) transporter